MSRVRKHSERKPHANSSLRKKPAGWISLQPQPLCSSLLSPPVCPWGHLHREVSLDSSLCSLNSWHCFFFLQVLTLTLCLALFLGQKMGVPVLPYPPFCYLWLGPYFVSFFPGAESSNLIHLVTWLREDQTVPSALYTG